MVANGQLVFTDVDKVTFKGVGNASNAVIDTTTGKIGVGVDSPDANLHVLGNCFVSTNFELGGTMTMGTVTVRAQHELSAITATGNTTPHTIEFTNAETGIVTTGNVGIGTTSPDATLHVSGNAYVSSNLEVGTANLFVDTQTSRVGLGTRTPESTLHVEGNVYVSSNLEVDGSTISTILSDQVPNVSWAKSIGATGSNDRGTGIATDSAGNVYVIGYYRDEITLGTITLTSGASTSDDAYVAKYDTSGTVLWATSIGGTSFDYGYGIATDSSGNVYVTGYYSGTAYFDINTSLNSAGGSNDVFVAKYNTSGAVQWAESIGGTSSDYGSGIATDSSGNVYVIGRYFGSTTIGTTILNSSGSNYDVFIAKYDTSGAVQWARRIGGTSSDYGYGIATDSAGNVYVTGQYQGEIIIGSTTLTNAGSSDVFVAKYDTGGTVQWAKSIGGTGSDAGNGIATDSSGNVYVTGYYNGTANFGPDTSLTSAGQNDAFVAKYDTSGTLRWAKSIGGGYGDFGYGIATDSVGNVYVTGSYQGAITIGSTTLTFTVSSGAFIARYDTNGAVQWATSIGGGSNSGIGIATDSAGNVYVTGNYEDVVDFGSGTSLTTAGNTDAFVAKYSPPVKLNINTSVDVQGDMNVASNLEVGRDLSVTGNLTVLGTRTIVDTDTLRVKDPIIELGKNNPGTGDLGLVMTRPSGSSNVAVVFDESTDTLEIGYTQNNASDSTITMDSAPLSVNVNGNVSVGKELTVSGNVAVDTDTLFVDSVNNRVGVGTMTPLSDLDLYNPAGTELIVSRNAGSSVNPSIRLWNFDDNNYNNHAVGTSVGTINFSGNERLTGDTHTDDSRAFSYANTLYDWARISALFVGSSDSATTTQGNVRGDLAFYTNNGDGATSDLQERMRIKHNGNVGIGTSSPSCTLDVRGSGQYEGIYSKRIWVANIGDNSGDGSPDDNTGSPWRGLGFDNLAWNNQSYKYSADIPILSGYNGVALRSGAGNLVLTQAGNVGIGTTSPSGTLHVQADNRVHITAGTVPAFTGVNAVSEGRSQLVLSSRYSDLVIASSYVNDNHGSTLSFAAVNPSNTAEYRKFVINQGNWGSRKDFLDFGLSASTADANPHSSINSTDTVLTLDGNNKRVGIGTISPGYKLHVYDGTAQASWRNFYVRPTSLWGDGLTTASETAGTKYMTMNMIMIQGPHITPSSTGADAYIRYGRAGGIASGVWWETACVTDGSFRIRREANDAYGMTITSAGNVGIGTTSPSYKLHVAAGDDSITFYGPNSTWSSYLAVGAASDKTAANNTTIAQCITTNGNLHLDAADTRDMYLNYYRGTNVRFGGAGTIIHSSDDRLKSEEELITNATDTLLKLSPQKYKKTYTLREDDSREPFIEAGLMAQDVWYDAPELRHLVHLGADANPTDTKPEAPVNGDIQQDPDYSSWGTEPAALNYDGLIAYLIKSNQELHARIQALENA